MRQVEVPYSDATFKRRLLHWGAQFPYCVFLDTCDTEVDRYGRYDFLMGVAFSSRAESHRELDSLEQRLNEDPLQWRFGVFTYDLKNSLESKLSSRHSSAIPFPELHFFVPDVVVYKPKDRDVVIFEKGFSKAMYDVIAQQGLPEASVEDFDGFTSNFSRDEYVETVQSLRNHIREGDCYEVNLAQNFRGRATIPSPAALWEQLVALSPVPFAGYARWGPIHLICASPERFLQLQAGRLLTQPIKGTAPRGKTPEADARLKQDLQASLKEQAENVMIVDLSRNDLYRSSEVNSVEVPHLLEVQTFPQVHHLVSSVTGKKRKDILPLQAFRNTFPPGSMTGAPKFRTCELIDHYEPAARGIYSGSLGYISPGGDFDLNVVIRSLVYNSQSRDISYHVGGAITWDSEPEAEYEETLVKARAIEALFQKFS